MLNYSGSGIETTFTQGEDACLASLVPELPAAAPPAPPRCSSSARSPTSSRTSCGGSSRELGIATGRSSCRRAAPTRCRPSDRARASCSRSRSSPTRRARSRNAARDAFRAPFPLGVEGTTAWLRAAADAFGVPTPRGSTWRPARRRERARRALARYRSELAGKRIFFFPDSQLEIPLARFLARELGMELRRSRHAVSAPAAPRGGTRAAARRHGALAKARTSTGSSIAAARCARTSSSAASASPIRSRPRA